MALLIVGGVTITAANGFAARYGPKIADAERNFAMPAFCNGCRKGAGSPDVVLWGDSFSRAAQDAVEDFAARDRLSLIVFSRSACIAMFDAQPAGDRGCARFHQHVRTQLANLDPKLIILVSRWAMGSETTRFGTEPGKRSFLADSRTRSNSVADSRRVLREGLTRTVATLVREHPKATIVLVSQAPALGVDAERCMIALETKHQCGEVHEGALARLEFSRQLLHGLAARFPNVEVVDLAAAFCRQSRCPTSMNGEFLYRDWTHLSDPGARLLLEPQLLKIWRARQESNLRPHA